MHGAPALPEGFAALPYANPDAPKGGRLVEGVLGTFDSLNPLIVKGLAVQAIRGYVVESLMARGYDEPFTLYGLLARTVETDDARSYVTFTLDPAAHFSDGAPVTAEDVVFSWQLLRDHGRPNHRTYYSKVAEADDPRCAHRAFRFCRQQRPRTAAHPRPDAGAAEARDRRRDLRGNDADEADRQRSLCRRRSRCRQERHVQARSRIIGAARCRSIAACGISTRSASIITATPTPISKPSRPGSTTCAARTIRAAGRPATIFRPCATAASSRNRFRAACRKPNSAFRLQHAAADLCRHPGAPGDFAAVRFRMGQPQLLLRSLSTQRRASSTTRNCPPTTARPIERERALLAPFPDAVRPDVLDGTWSPPVSDGSGRDRADTAPGARAAAAPPATSSTARRCASARATGRSASRSW